MRTLKTGRTYKTFKTALKINHVLSHLDQFILIGLYRVIWRKIKTFYWILS